MFVFLLLSRRKMFISRYWILDLIVFFSSEDDDAPNLLNLFSDEQSNTYTLFDPRVKPEEKPSLFVRISVSLSF